MRPPRTLRPAEGRGSSRIARPLPATSERELADRSLGLLLALVSLVVVVTCSAASPAPSSLNDPQPPLPSDPLAAAAPAAHQSELPSSPAFAPEHGAAQPVAAPRGVPELARFFAALEALQTGSRDRHVRIGWLGDSHTAADLWTHAVRRALQARFGVGGPGFVHLGIKQSRHSQLKLEVLGSWQRLPTQPSRTQPFLDGVFGLGGMRAVAKHTARFQARLLSGAVAGGARWQIAYRLPRGASFELRLSEHRESFASTSANQALIQQQSFEVPAEAELTLRQLSGLPEFYGAVIESTQPGLVLDTLGIDGAKARTPLAWQESAWVAALKQRAPELVVLAYGTNEVFEQHAADVYQKDYRELLERVRSVLPDADCLIIGPTDVAQTPGVSHPRVLEISSVQQTAAGALGCGYLGAHQLMGGEGSYTEWQTSTPPFAGADGVHLTARGYQELGTLTAEYLLTNYERFVQSR